MVHRALYPRRRWPRLLWLIWMTVMAIGVGSIAMILALVAGLALVVLCAGWVVDLH